MFNQSLEPWAAKVAEETNGAVEIKIFPGQSLGKLPDQWDMVNSGICDISFIIPGFSPGTFPMTTDISNMFGVVPMGRHLSFVNGLYDKFLKEEWASTKILWPHILGDVAIHTSKKPVRALEDLEGLMIRTPGGMIPKTLTGLGATPASMPSGEVFTALERGTVDGCTFPMEAVKGFKIYEVTKYHTTAAVACGFASIVMNLDTWNSLPPEIQKVIDDLSPMAQQIMTEAADAEDEAAIKTCLEVGNEIITLTPEERARWIEKIQPVNEKVISDWDANGLPGTALVEEAKRLAAEVQ